MRKSRKQLISERTERRERERRNHKENLKERYIKKFRALYGDKFDYPDDFYTKDGKISVVCPIHGLFKSSIQSHLSGSDCPFCNPTPKRKNANPQAKDSYRTTRRKHCQRSLELSIRYQKRLEQKNSKEQVVKCTTKNKQSVKRKKKCKTLSVFNKGIPSKGEVDISLFLDSNGIKYYREWKLPNEYLFNRRKYVLADFYLPDYNTVIEYNGQQHYFHVSWFGGKDVFEMQQERDYGLRLYCKEHGINLIEISYKDNSKIKEILGVKVKKPL